MALDMVITDSHGNTEMSVPLYLEDYDFIVRRIENEENFPLLNKVLADYYGASEIYLNELANLQNEIFQLRSIEIGPNAPSRIAGFTESFFSLIKYAIENTKTIQFVGD